MPKWNRVRQAHLRIEKTEADTVQQLSANPTEFFTHVLGFKPYQYQQEFIKLFQENQFTAARWCRQSGKTYIISALLLWYAMTHPNIAVAIVGPSWRQTKRIISRINSFSHKLPPSLLFKPQKTQIHFPNGSSIEAFPNNPETIRGPTFDLVYADELNFVANDQELYDAILYTLGATNGKFVCSSTPWHTDSIFYKIFNDKNFTKFKTSHVPVEKALEPNGPLKNNIIEEIKIQMGEDQQRWRREMQAEWTEDEDAWLTQSLIVSCIGTTKTCGEELQEFNPDSNHDGDFYAGLDLGQTIDDSVLAIAERINTTIFLRHLKIYQQPTLYAHVLGYLKTLQDRWGGFEEIRIDSTREGPSIIADMENAGINNVEGVHFTVPKKSEIASLLKQRMQSHQFFYPLITWERPYRGDICTELNTERHNLRKDGTIGFSHPYGTHDDVWWATALAVYAAAETKPETFLTVIRR